MLQDLLNNTDIEYPESDGQPMADNTLQFRWIVTIKENLEICFAHQPHVFVAGDLLWYPVQGQNRICQAPDVLVVFGRPKGERGSYKQWEEDNIPPQVVFEVLSPSNHPLEMQNKLLFYQKHGVQEYYMYSPHRNQLAGALRRGDLLESIEQMDGWISPLLNIRFQLLPDTLEIYTASGRKFLTPVELNEVREQERQRAEQERQRAEQERQRAEQAMQELEQEKQRTEQEKLRADTALEELSQERQRYQALLEQLKARGIEMD
ncbi:Uma2 family endonuclease [Spirulina subsalsa FACHB-351]|uniref:Uma2 family endonuclease n=1 Tax=Spirulina subsalsa FACHB-351 TaxID=234711 RepID=A0ABT3KZY9_9CYAN|nr:Uma2 family endonuclease [Spirulina subsalsa]MCW6034820.1 Uma2 family endonuclease [Spirulina subsalsa FACHB-351]